MTSPQPISVLTYRNMWKRLAERFDVVAVDLANHGGSDATSDLITVDGHAAFLGEILDHFELEGVASFRQSNAPRLVHPRQVRHVPNVGVTGRRCQALQVLVTTS